MPRLGQISREDIEIEAAWNEFESVAAWRRSKKGNLWRHFEGMTLTIFKRADGFYGWSIADEDGPRFSPGGYDIESDAMSALGCELGIGEC